MARPYTPVRAPRGTQLTCKSWLTEAALDTYLAALAGSIALSTTVTDYVHALPDWAETIIYPAVLAGVSLLSGRAASSKPGYLSPSTIEAVETWLRRELPRRR